MPGGGGGDSGGGIAGAGVGGRRTGGMEVLFPWIAFEEHVGGGGRGDSDGVVVVVGVASMVLLEARLGGVRVVPVASVVVDEIEVQCRDGYWHRSSG